VVHRNPSYWPDPDRFDPDRFLDSALSTRPRYAYLPFGGGPHTCIAESIALAEIVAVLAGLTRRHRLVLKPGSSTIPEPGITLRPKGLRMLIERRDSR
jgi:cytochrome P450